jgi:hypothetical protein
MASDRLLVPLGLDHSFIRVTISRDNRTPISESRPVAGLPRLFDFIDFTGMTRGEIELVRKADEQPAAYAEASQPDSPPKPNQRNG